MCHLNVAGACGMWSASHRRVLLCMHANGIFRPVNHILVKMEEVCSGSGDGGGGGGSARRF